MDIITTWTSVLFALLWVCPVLAGLSDLGDEISSLSQRANCRTIQVVFGDTCDSLAAKCGISGNDFNKYNTIPNLCSTLAVAQHVCCSSGTLPDFAPKPNEDGSCATYTVQEGEGCSTIAANFAITTANLDTFNKNTWRWPTCAGIIDRDQVICISEGTPPMPATVDGTVCGPQVPGTTRPSGTFDLSTLNPCPLNVCCDIWGQCGATMEFCNDTRHGGAPGTAAPGSNGCISNCGTDIVSGNPPAQFISVGYYEAWNENRPCLWMDPSQISPNKYTHIHFAFARLNPDLSVDVSYVQRQFDLFKQMSSFKKILAFGGWADSTSPTTYLTMRDMVLPANRDRAAQNMADFIIANNLDGIDIDWEYPGEQDIDGIPPASKTEGEDYLNFLVVLRSKLQSGKTLSIATPSSY